MHVMLRCLFLIAVAWSTVVVAASEELPAAATVTASAPGKVALIKIDGTIEPFQTGYFKRSLEQALADDVDTIVTHINSPGGRLDSLLNMMEPLLAIDEQPRLIAFIDSQAISAAAALAFGHHEIHLSPQAKIGDIGVVFQSPDGKMEYAPEKIETFVRTKLRSLGQIRGWNEALLAKMTARNQSLYEIHFDDGRIDFILSDDLEPYLIRNPDINPETQVVKWLGEDRLLTLTSQEAIDLGMATVQVKTLDGVFDYLGVAPSDVLDLTPTQTEQIARSLAGWAPLILALCILFITLELKTPGVGIWAGLAGLTGVGFFVCQYYLDMANHFEVVLMLLGIALVVVEIFTAIGAGFIGVSGGLLFLIGAVFAFMPNGIEFDPSAEGWAQALATAIWDSLLAIIVAIGGLFAAVAMLPHTVMMRHVAVMSEISETSNSGSKITDTLIGLTGTTSGDLHPGGWVVIGDTTYSARSQDGLFIESGTAITVVKHEFGDLVVTPETSDQT